jgi:hypothetical protein
LFVNLQIFRPTALNSTEANTLLGFTGHQDEMPGREQAYDRGAASVAQCFGFQFAKAALL